MYSRLMISTTEISLGVVRRDGVRVDDGVLERSAVELGRSVTAFVGIGTEISGALESSGGRVCNMRDRPGFVCGSSGLRLEGTRDH